MIREILKTKTFLVGLFLRLAFLGFSGSVFLREYFVPFLDRAVINPGTNPWSLSPPAFFPYGSVLFLILYLPRELAYLAFGPKVLGTSLTGLALIRGPIVIFDLALFLVLVQIAGNRSKKILYYYWLSPIVFYTIWMGQLDVVAMAFCLFSLQQACNQKTVLSAVTMAAAVLCKFHVALTIPFLLTFIWNTHFAKEAIRKMLVWLGIFGLITAIGFLPVISAGNLLYATTASPDALRLLAMKVEFNQHQVLYLGLLFVLSVLARLCISSRITELGLLFGSGVLFGTLLLVTNPWPNWYLWVLPFIALAYALYGNVPAILYQAMVVFYLAYFAVFQPYVPSPLLNGIVLTLLQTSLLGILIHLAFAVLKVETPLGRRVKPLAIGLAGDSGTGKDRLSAALTKVFTPENTLVIEGDDYHKWERGSDYWNHYTHLNPKANNLKVMASHAIQLGRGIPVHHPHYDHVTGQFTPPRELKPAKTIIIQGLHSFYLRGMRSAYDLKIFLSPDERVRRAWKTRRDVLERGHPPAKVEESLARRSADSTSHIQPQMHLADWIIQYELTRDIDTEEVLQGKPVHVSQRHIVWNDAPLSGIVDSLATVGGCQSEWIACPTVSTGW